MLEQIKRDYQSQFVILDLPPVLSSDDVLAYFATIGLRAARDGSRHLELSLKSRNLTSTLQSSEIVRVVLNKVPASQSEVLLLLGDMNVAFLQIDLIEPRLPERKLGRQFFSAQRVGSNIDHSRCCDIGSQTS